MNPFFVGFEVSGDEARPWEIVGYYRPGPDEEIQKKNINEIRIELADRDLNKDGEVNGRVFFDLKNAAKVDYINLDVNYTLQFTNKNGDQEIVGPMNCL